MTMERILLFQEIGYNNKQMKKFAMKKTFRMRVEEGKERKKRKNNEIQDLFAYRAEANITFHSTFI